MQKLAACFGAGDIDDILARQNPGDWTTTTVAAGTGRLGLLAHPRAAGRYEGLLGPGLHRWGNDCLLIAGGPLNVPALATLPDLDAAVAALCAADGTFAAIGWDARRQRLLLITDPMGLRPLHIRQEAGSILVASDTKVFPYEPDAAGWAAFIRCGELIGDRTLARGVRRVDGGQVVSIDPVTGVQEARRYWHFEGEGAPPALDDVIDLLVANARDYARHFPQSQCLMSGGYDSRLIAFTLARAGIHPPTLTVAHADEYGDLDGRIAGRMARLAGLENRRVHPGEDFFSSPAFLDYLWASDGTTPCLYLFIAQVAQFLDGTPTWEGNLPAGLFKAVRNPRGRGLTALADTMIGSPDKPAWQAARRLFKPGFVAAMEDGLRHDWAQSVTDLPDDAAGVWQWAACNHMRARPGINPFRVFPNRGEVLSLGATQTLWQQMARLDPLERLDDAYVRRLLARLDARALSLPLMHGNSLTPPTHRSLLYRALNIELHLRRFIERHPSAGRLFGLTKTGGFAPSIFMATDALWTEDDPLLDMDALRVLRQGPRDVITERMLLHWRATRWLHEKRLFTQFNAPTAPTPLRTS
ncbi:hypothetical protein [Parapedomonas caeni]